jgi:hypothetical protein
MHAMHACCCCTLHNSVDGAPTPDRRVGPATGGVWLWASCACAMQEVNRQVDSCRAGGATPGDAAAVQQVKEVQCRTRKCIRGAGTQQALVAPHALHASRVGLFQGVYAYMISIYTLWNNPTQGWCCCAPSPLGLLLQRPWHHADAGHQHRSFAALLCLYPFYAQLLLLLLLPVLLLLHKSCSCQCYATAAVAAGCALTNPPSRC